MTSGPITWGGTLGENPAAGTAATIVGKSLLYYPRSGRRYRSDWRRNAYEPKERGRLQAALLGQRTYDAGAWWELGDRGGAAAAVSARLKSRR
jgi:hypothetical protein